MRFRLPKFSSKTRFPRAVEAPGGPDTRQRVKRGTRSRQAALWLAGTALVLVALWNLLPNPLADKGQVAQAMRRDAQTLGAAAWKHFETTAEREVSFSYDPETGAVSGPLAVWVTHIQPGYTVVDSTIEAFEKNSFSLHHPNGFAANTIWFDSHGEPQESPKRTVRRRRFWSIFP